MSELARRRTAPRKVGLRRGCIAALLAALVFGACADAPATETSLERASRAPDVVGKSIERMLALRAPEPRVRSEAPPEDAALRGVVDLAWQTKGQPEESVRSGLLALVRASTEPPLVTVDEDTRGSVSFQGRVPNPYGVDAQAAETFARTWFAALALAPGRDLTLRLRARDDGEMGELHLSFDVVLPAPERDPARAQPVWNVSLHAHFDADAALTGLHGTGLLPIDPPDALRIDAEAAQRAAAQALPPTAAAMQMLGTPTLGVWRALSESGKGAYAFRVEHARGQEVFASFVDARTGTLLSSYPLSHSESGTPIVGSAQDYDGAPIPVQASYDASTKLYSLFDQSQPALGHIYTHDGDNQEVFVEAPELLTSSDPHVWDVAGATAHHNARLVIDYLGKLGRSSWDGQGGDLHVVVHVGDALQNAYFVSAGAYSTLRFGDGVEGMLFDTGGCLDIVAHELGHGVVATTVPLVYLGMSGALNESIADVFGALVDDANWTLAEHCVGSVYGYLRSMQWPPAKRQPGVMLDYKKLSPDVLGDFGGVHINSGIPNRAAYLFAAARGRPMLGKVWYQTLKGQYISKNASFNHMALGTLAACADLVKANAAAPADCTALANAWASVGVTVLSSTGACPAYAHALGGVCVCEIDRTPSASGTACIPLASVICPANSQIVEGECTCAAGFHEVDGACTDDPHACPANSAYDEQTKACKCSEGFEGKPLGTGGCLVLPSTCPSKAHPEWEDDDQAERSADYTCVCNSGYAYDPAAGDCAVLPDSCGAETFRGRCDGNRLVYCTSAGKLSNVDCASAGYRCGELDPLHGFDCLNDEGVAPAGVCDPALSQQCDAASPLCVSRRGDAQGFCSFTCVTGLDCPSPFACCASIGDGSRACLLEPYCATASDARSVCADGSTAYGDCLSDRLLSYCDPATRKNVQTDCGTGGQVCGLESPEAGYACVDDPTPKSSGTDACPSAGDGVCDVPARCPLGSDVRDCNPCGGVSAEGNCSGAVLEVCDLSLGMVSVDCAQMAPGLTCAVVDSIAACRTVSEQPVVDATPAAASEGCSSRGRAGSGSLASALALLGLATLLRRRGRRLVD